MMPKYKVGFENYIIYFYHIRVMEIIVKVITIFPAHRGFRHLRLNNLVYFTAY